MRGGLDVLEAFAILRERYPHVRLTIRSTRDALDDHYHRIMEAGWVRVIDRFLTAEEMEALRESVKFSIRAVTESRETPPELKRAKLATLESALAKLPRVSRID